ERAGRALVVAVAAYGVATIVFGLSRWFPLSIAAYMAVGMADQVSVVMRGTAIQLSDRKSTRLNSSHVSISYAVFCLKKKKVIRCTDCTTRGLSTTQNGLSYSRLLLIYTLTPTCSINPSTLTCRTSKTMRLTH